MTLLTFEMIDEVLEAATLRERHHYRRNRVVIELHCDTESLAEWWWMFTAVVAGAAATTRYLKIQHKPTEREDAFMIGDVLQDLPSREQAKR